MWSGGCHFTNFTSYVNPVFLRNVIKELLLKSSKNFHHIRVMWHKPVNKSGYLQKSISMEAKPWSTEDISPNLTQIAFKKLHSSSLSPENSWFIFFNILFIHLRQRDKRERAWAGGEAEGEEEADSPLSQEPNVGLDPRTLGSWSEPKADA